MFASLVEDESGKQDVKVAVVLPQIDTKQRTFTLKSGKVFKLRPISGVVIRRLQNDFWGMPQPPVVESEVGPNKKKVKVGNPDDPEYIQKKQEWEVAKNERILLYIWTVGVLDEPTDQDIERLKQFLPGATPEIIKYTWIAEHFLDDSEIGLLTEAITSQNQVTEQGVSEAEQSFRPES